jgi:hypothetical protein
MGAEWVATLNYGKEFPMRALKLFLLDYIPRQRLDTVPARFLRAGYKAPCLYTTCLTHLKNKKNIRAYYKTISVFLAYVLMHYFSIENDDGVSIVSPGFRNPIPTPPGAVDKHADECTESNKNVLPYRFIVQLQTTLCPKNALSFTDWKWAQTGDDTRVNRGAGSSFLRL